MSQVPLFSASLPASLGRFSLAPPPATRSYTPPPLLPSLAAVSQCGRAHRFLAPQAILSFHGGDVGTQYRSGIYYYTPEQEKAAKESLEKHQQVLNRKIVTEILPAKKFYRAEEYHQQYLAKGGRFGLGQSAAKGCNDPIRCYG